MRSRIVPFSLAAAALIAALGLSFASSVSADSGGPTALLSSTVTGNTNLTSVPLSVTFSEPVNGFTTSGIETTNASVSALQGSNATYTFTLQPIAAGTSTVMIIANAATSASSTIGNQASNAVTFNFSKGTASTTATSTSATTTTTTTAATSTSTTSPPVLSNIAVNDSNAANATVTWNTDQPATSQVFYGVNTFYGASTAEDTGLVTSHSQTFYGLVAGTTYHFYVVSTDAGGSASSTDMAFVAGSGTGASGSSTSTTTASTSTASTASSTPLAFTGVTSVQSNATADGTFADGWQWVLHFSVPSNENFLSMKFGDFANTAGTSSGTIPAASNIEFFSPQSTNAMTSAAALKETNNDYSSWLMLGATSTANQNIDVYVNVAVPSGTPAGTYSTTFGAFSNTSASTTTTP